MNDSFDAFERRGWEGRAAAYDRGFARLTAHTAGALLDAAGVDSRTRVLDVGCGPGTVTGAALARGAAVTAVDADLDMMELVARRHPAAQVRLGVLPELPFADEEFDAVVAGFVINHTGDPAAALDELYRLLRPGGSIALTCWHPATRTNTVFTEAREAAGVAPPAGIPQVAPFQRHADPASFAALLTAAGFSGAATDTLTWTHRVDPGAWWDDVVAGTALNGAMIASLDSAAVAGTRAAYDRIVATYAVGDQIDLPAMALLAHGTR
jgi:SAM-dependent methyltransferase